jgi:hypothetical protein
MHSMLTKLYIFSDGYRGGVGAGALLGRLPVRLLWSRVQDKERAHAAPGRQAGRQADRKVDRQVVRQADRQVDR